MLSLRLIRRNEGSADILVLNQTDGIGNAGGSGIAHCRIQAGIRYAYDQIRICGMLLRQLLTGTDPEGMNRLAVDNRIRTGKVDILENTEVTLLRRMLVNNLEAVLIDHNDLARLNIPNKLGAHCIQCAALRSKYIASVIQNTIAQRLKAVRISAGNKLGR